MVDDLTDGFAVVGDHAGGFRLGVGAGAWSPSRVQSDHGLPVYRSVSGPNGRGWQRQELPGAFGKYRRTSARARAGAAREEAVFSVRIPHPGRWRLYYHLPYGGEAGEQGVYHLRVRTSDVDIPLKFDAGAGRVGWNDIGSFTLPYGRADVVVSSESSGPVVYADAIRWWPTD